MGLYFALGLVGVAVDFYVAVKFKKIAEDKGYDSMEYLIVCFFLTFIGYIMVAALPDRKKYELPVYDREGSEGKTYTSRYVGAGAVAQPATPAKPVAEEKTTVEVKQPVNTQVAAEVPNTAVAQPETAVQTETENTQENADKQEQEIKGTEQKAPATPISPQISFAPDFELPVPEFVKRQEEAKAAEAAKTPEQRAAEEAAAKAAAEEAAAKAAAEAAAKAAEEEAARLAEEERHRGVGRAPFKPEVHPEVSIDSPQAQLDKFGELPDL